MIDHTKVKLGKRPAKKDPRTLRLARYFTAILPPAPPAVDYTGNVLDWGVMLNNDLGCCTISACGHAEQVWSLRNGKMYTVPDAGILQKYEMWCGYDPKDPSTDQGGVEIDVLNQWRNTKFWGHKIHAYADTDPGTIENVRQSIYLFGGVYIGLQLPISAQTQMTWDVTHGPDSEPGSWGGHAIYVPAYDEHGLIGITWGELKRMSWNFWRTYCDESHAIFGVDWQVPGIDMATLNSDLAIITA